jgi:hypothetical protein
VCSILFYLPFTEEILIKLNLGPLEDIMQVVLDSITMPEMLALMHGNWEGIERAQAPVANYIRTTTLQVLTRGVEAMRVGRRGRERAREEREKERGRRGRRREGGRRRGGREKREEGERERI